MTFNFTHNRRKYTELTQLWLVHRLPRWLIYWAAIRLIAHAAQGKYGKQVVPKLPVREGLRALPAEKLDGLVQLHREVLIQVRPLRIDERV